MLSKTSYNGAQSSMRRSLSKRNMVLPINRSSISSNPSTYKRSLHDTNIMHTYLNLYYQGPK